MPRKTKQSVRAAKAPSSMPVHGKREVMTSRGSPAASTTVGALVARMGAKLRKEYGRIKKLLTSDATNSLLARHQVALIVQRVKRTPARYGSGAVRELEAALCLDAKTLYRWAIVADAWPNRGALKKLTLMKNSSGLPLTWSHLELLSDLDDPARRAEATEKALAQSWSVRQLRTWIYEATRPSESRPVVLDAPTMEDAAADLARTAETFAWTHDQWRKLYKRLPEGPMDPSIVRSLRRAQTATSQLKDACAETLEEIASALSRAKPPPPVAPPAPTTPAAAV
jgi:hypothetical protein